MTRPVGLQFTTPAVLTVLQGSAADAAGDVDVPGYAHVDVDRFAVLLDLWSHHAAFLQSKREVRLGGALRWICGVRRRVYNNTKHVEAQGAVVH